MRFMSVPFSDTDNIELTSQQFSTYLWDGEPVEVCAVTDCVPWGTGNQPQHLPKKGLSCQKNLKIKNSYPMKNSIKKIKISQSTFLISGGGSTTKSTSPATKKGTPVIKWKINNLYSYFCCQQWKTCVNIWSVTKNHWDELNIGRDVREERRSQRIYRILKWKYSHVRSLKFNKQLISVHLATLWSPVIRKGILKTHVSSHAETKMLKTEKKIGFSLIYLSRCSTLFYCLLNVLWTHCFSFQQQTCKVPC